MATQEIISLQHLSSMDDSLKSLRFYSVIGTVALTIMCVAITIALFMVAEEARRTLRTIAVTSEAATDAAVSLNQAVSGASDATNSLIPSIRRTGPIISRGAQSLEGTNPIIAANNAIAGASQAVTSSLTPITPSAPQTQNLPQTTRPDTRF